MAIVEVLKGKNGLRIAKFVRMAKLAIFMQVFDKKWPYLHIYKAIFLIILPTYRG